MNGVAFVDHVVALFTSRARLDATHDHRTVGTAKTEGVRQSDINLHIARSIGAVVEIALRVLVEDVDGGRRGVGCTRQVT